MAASNTGPGSPRGDIRQLIAWALAVQAGDITWATLARDQGVDKGAVRKRYRGRVPESEQERIASLTAAQAAAELAGSTAKIEVALSVPPGPFAINEPAPTESPHVLTTEEESDLLTRLMDHVIEQQDLLGTLANKQPVVTLPIDDPLPTMMVWMTDTHIGHEGVDHRKWRADLDLIGSEDGVWMAHGGDVADNFQPLKHATGMRDALIGPDLQWRIYRNEVGRRAPGRTKAMVQGNHDAWASELADCHPVQWLARELGAHYLGPGGRVWLRTCHGLHYKLELRHDFPFKSSLNTTNSQRRLFEFALGAHAVLFGHLHYPDLHYKHIGEVDVVLGRSGTYKMSDTWAENKGLLISHQPPPPDMLGIMFFPDVVKLIPFRNFRDGLPLLRHWREQYRAGQRYSA